MLQVNTAATKRNTMIPAPHMRILLGVTFNPFAEPPHIWISENKWAIMSHLDHLWLHVLCCIKIEDLAWEGGKRKEMKGESFICCYFWADKGWIITANAVFLKLAPLRLHEALWAIKRAVPWKSDQRWRKTVAKPDLTERRNSIMNDVLWFLLIFDEHNRSKQR